MLSLRTLVPLLTTAILLVAPAEATTSYYTGSSGETSFNTAVAGLTLLDPALTFSSGDLSPGVGLLNASGTGIDFLGFDTAFSGCCGPLGFTVNAGQLTATQDELVKINLPVAGIYAFGIHIASTDGNWCVDLTATGPCAYNIPNTSPAVQFFGFVSSAPVSAPLYIHYASGNPTLVLANFKAYGAGADPVPEPRTMLLVGLGLITLPLVRQKTRRRNQRGLS